MVKHLKRWWYKQTGQYDKAFVALMMVMLDFSHDEKLRESVEIIHGDVLRAFDLDKFLRERNHDG